MRAAILGLSLTLMLGGVAPAQADAIKRACIDSGRTGANYALCGCIQSVANQTLSRSEQRKAASFFAEPHRAQEVRQSDRASDERFWTRYRQFGAVAQNACS
ncbi:hypothetical protein Dshi_2614 [Dinoroseobacter shibae DFL 12 = DSM 16493]|uniref:Arginine transporter n=1 Tax=Dinoroseobacter shibae (strain DSM 16493 / NCIMB 14021 / DFL 12) TaxID=398580 RepID=A8LI13_DINSH|nr:MULTISPECIES: hypothetical protein [Dinoroseobacter]ABV94347.1 hypothetical protein Dshi_2614 [Dinoroseobacter shibae DFL 12 = DSM 16493]MDD9717689.1 hypothetical protein [Dinoroseobacter sp. PD6]URF45778.1 hypothetical protein M8008_13475 [Dinoroseobacter shibae]URF50084.1 hypothetical protein M8007_13475 [Dinoroseobacter shibae]